MERAGVSVLIFASWSRSRRDREEKEDGGVARVEVRSVPGHRRQVHERVGVHAMQGGYLRVGMVR